MSYPWVFLLTDCFYFARSESTTPAAQTSSKAEVIDLTGLSDSSESDSEHSGDDSISDEGSEASEIEITLSAETRAQLQMAITTVSETRLRDVLKTLVETDVRVEALLTREFVTLRRGTQAVVPRYDTCLNCDKEFDINTDREETECVFHPGERHHFRRDCILSHLDSFIRQVTSLR